MVTVKNNAENGYIGLVNSSGALEIGDREEADIGIVKKSEVLIDLEKIEFQTVLRYPTKNKGCD